jgi:16S rRNA (adenine1518-N6/adenine1519-N6)-dimethyltransferase
MLQKEVVDRITASAGDTNYSRLSVMVQSNYNVASLFDIHPNDFTPPPKVNSSFLRLVPTDMFQKQIKNPSIFNKLVETAFQQRRKTIRNSLSKMVNKEQLRNANIQTTQRPQEISIPQYINLSNELAS